MYTKTKKSLGRLLIIAALCAVLVTALAACDFTITTAADKTALQTAITAADTVKAAADYEDYTLTTRTAFETALTAAKAVNNDADATQADVNTAKNNLITAQNNLIIIVAVDKTELQAAILAADTVKAATDYEDYTLTTRTAFETALTAAKAVNNDADATQADVNTAKNNLTTAQNGLIVTAIADKTELQAAILAAETVKAAADYEDYTSSTRTAFETALTAAKAVNNDADATQIQVGAATQQLLAATDLLVIDDEEDDNKDESSFDRYAGLLMIWQIGTAKDGAITRNFIELYNNSEDDINLEGYSIQYSKAIGNSWKIILLEGTIKAHTSFLILGDEGSSLANGRLFFEDGDGDLEAEFTLDNDGYKVFLVHSTELIDIVNPFDIDENSTVLQGYVDFVGAYNGDTPDAAEGNPVAKMSKQQSARRISLTDTNDNNADFTNIDYRSSGVTDEEMQDYRPKNQAYGQWNPLTFEITE